MKIAKKEIEKIKEHFDKMQTKNDLLNLLNEANKLLFNEKAELFSLKSITYYSSPNKSLKRYHEFSINKKSGGKRTINAPVSGLKSIQRALNLILQCIFEPHEAAAGFVPGKSIVDNAKAHTGKNYVYNIDLKDFFTSIEQARIWKRLQNPPFNLNHTTGRIELANRIAAICCAELNVERINDSSNTEVIKKYVLPQGAPTSPTITNIIANRLDRKLSGLAKRFKLTYTRYADDITFSSNHNVYQENSVFITELNRIITDQNFIINPKKTRLQKSDYRQETTGIIVNKKVNVQSKYVKKIRMWLYYWEKYGYEKSQLIFLKDYIADKGHVKKAKPNLINVLDGKLEFLKMVKGIEDETHKGLKERFDLLVGYTDPTNQLLDIWESEGIDKAMEVYYKDKLD